MSLGISYMPMLLPTRLCTHITAAVVASLKDTKIRDGDTMVTKSGELVRVSTDEARGRCM